MEQWDLKSNKFKSDANARQLQIEFV